MAEFTKRRLIVYGPGRTKLSQEVLTSRLVRINPGLVQVLVSPPQFFFNEGQVKKIEIPKPVKKQRFRVCIAEDEKSLLQLPSRPQSAPLKSLEQPKLPLRPQSACLRLEENWKPPCVSNETFTPRCRRRSKILHGLIWTSVGYLFS